MWTTSQNVEHFLQRFSKVVHGNIVTMKIFMETTSDEAASKLICLTICYIRHQNHVPLITLRRHFDD